MHPSIKLEKSCHGRRPCVKEFLGGRSVLASQEGDEPRLFALDATASPPDRNRAPIFSLADESCFPCRMQQTELDSVD